MIKYIGSKRLLVSRIVEIVDALPNVERVTDLFSGTSRVGMAIKRSGRWVRSNDHNLYAHALATCHVAADADAYGSKALQLIEELKKTPSIDGWFTETYCRKARFFHPDNGVSEGYEPTLIPWIWNPFFGKLHWSP